MGSIADRKSSLTDAQRDELKAHRARLVVNARHASRLWGTGAVARLLYEHRWTFAKTMVANPHYWTARKDWLHGAESWEAVVQYIRDNGRTMRFGKSDYTVWDLNGWRYWSMGDTLDRTMVINRAANVGEYAAAAVVRIWGDGLTGGEVVGGPAQ